ncbi:MAG: leucyl aminopeptidase [Desulfovibrionaceae bacterium]|nr:leucyl aminopeptidase [Desulfovibrionaceae bacterium]
MTDIRFQGHGPEQWKGDALLLFLCRGERLDACREIDTAAPWLTIAPAGRDVTGDADAVSVLYGHPSCPVPRVVVAGLGERAALTPDKVRKAAAQALGRCRELGLGSVVLPVPMLAGLAAPQMSVSRLLEESVCGALLGLYRFTQLKTATDGDKPGVQWLAVACNEEYIPDDMHTAARRGERDADAVARARDLANMPPNLLYPAALADKARELAARHGFSCTVLDRAALEELGCGCLLAVGSGSVREPRLIVLEHAPRGHEEEAPLAFIGKGLTFDSGGICIKPPQNMHTMKSDMSGAAAVLSTLCAVADEELPRRVVGILTSAENMPSGSAMRPGDVVRSLNGATVEILNTDAEGRLALCDAMTYAQRRFRPSVMVDIATLTGACAVALGQEIAGLFTDDAALAHAIMSHGAAAGETFWQLPLWSGYGDNLKSDVADISHMGPREGGAIHAALFLKFFVEEGVRWAHLDIAGTDWIFKKTPLCPVGAAGYGVRTLLELARNGI